MVAFSNDPWAILNDPLLRAGLSEEERQKARERGTIFTGGELAAILALWAGAFDGQPIHSLDCLRLPLKSGGAVEITPRQIVIQEKNVSAETLHATMLHIAAQWGGKADFYVEEFSRADRLKIRAYAEVYGIEFKPTIARSEMAESAWPEPFTAEEIATLPALRHEIRARHGDAPPERPNEEAELIAMYERRNHAYRQKLAA